MDLYCAACRVLVPTTKAYAGKAIGGACGAAMGLSTKTIGGAIVAGLVGLAVGHLIDEAVKPVCGHCRLGLTPVR